MSTIHMDEGWAWAVPIGGFIANFIVGGLAKSFGIIMSSTQELFNSPEAPLTLAGGLIYTFMYSLSPVGIILCEKFGCKTIMNIGAFGCVLSFICAFFSTTVTHWVIAIGGGVGISLGMLYSPIFVMVARCFKHRVGIAMGLSVTGVSVGQMLFPYIISCVIDTYAARGAYLVGAGIAMHFFVTANLMPRYIAEEEMNKMKKTTTKKRKNSIQDHDVEQLPLKEMSNGITVNVITNHTTNPNSQKKPNSFTTIHKVMLIIFIIAKVFGDVGDVGIAFALPPYGMKSLSMTEINVSLAIAVAGAVDLVARIFVGFISDQKWCRRSLLLAAAWLLEGLNSFFFVWFPYFTSYFIFYGIFGLTSGIAITLMTLVITDLVGRENMPISFGIMMFVLGLIISPGQFLVGYLADKTGSYVVSMKFLGANMLLAFAFLILEYPIKILFFNTRSAVADNKLKPKDTNGSVNTPITDDLQNLIDNNPQPNAKGLVVV